jgi:hypothetical protein
MRLSFLIPLGIGLAVLPSTSHAWGNEGHQLVVELAMQFNPGLRTRLGTVLASMERSREFDALRRSGVKEHPFYQGDRAVA